MLTTYGMNAQHATEYFEAARADWHAYVAACDAQAASDAAYVALRTARENGAPTAAAQAAYDAAWARTRNASTHAWVARCWRVDTWTWEPEPCDTFGHDAECRCAACRMFPETAAAQADAYAERDALAVASRVLEDARDAWNAASDAYDDAYRVVLADDFRSARLLARLDEARDAYDAHHDAVRDAREARDRAQSLADDTWEWTKRAADRRI